MIIFGSRTLTSSLGGGVFNCPRCNAKRDYSHQQLNRWFTLYFIPCIPMGSAGEYVECTACGGTYGVEILGYDPAADRADTMALLRRLAVLALLHAQRFGSENINALSSALQRISGEFVSEQEIRRDASLAQQANAQLSQVLRAKGSEFSADGKALLLSLMAEALTAGGSMGMVERQTLHEAGAALGVPQNVVANITG